MIGIFFGSTTGTTESVANQIAQELGISSTDIHNVSETPAEATDKYSDAETENHIPTHFVMQ